jgi:hypothetical protein
VGTESDVSEPDAYCRDIETYLCKKNDGHLIRIVGPAFEQVTSWSQQGIPLKIVFAGIDRYFERYYRKGPRRRPVRVEFCEADIRDVFDEWRRAVGVARLPSVAGGDEQEHASPARKSSLAGHIERVLARLTVVRGSAQLGGALGEGRRTRSPGGAAAGDGSRAQHAGARDTRRAHAHDD